MTLRDLVNWADDALMEGDIQSEDPEVVRDILARLGLADVKAFGLLWDDNTCVSLEMRKFFC